MRKTNENLEILPKVYFGSGEACITTACDFARKGKQVAVFMEQRNRPSHWVVQSKGLYALCDADLETDAGLKRALHLVEHQRFDVLCFASHPNEDDEGVRDYLVYGREQIEVIKAAVFTAFEFHTRYERLTLEIGENETDFTQDAA